MFTANFYSIYGKRESARLPAPENALPRQKMKIQALPVSPRPQSEVIFYCHIWESSLSGSRLQLAAFECTDQELQKVKSDA